MLKNQRRTGVHSTGVALRVFFSFLFNNSFYLARISVFVTGHHASLEKSMGCVLGVKIKTSCGHMDADGAEDDEPHRDSDFRHRVKKLKIKFHVINEIKQRRSRRVKVKLEQDKIIQWHRYVRRRFLLV
jgi:hypothetical protein